MYLTLSETAKYLDLQESDIMRFIQEKQINYLVVDGSILINKNQFNLFIKARKKYLEEMLEQYDEPIPEDVDVKDED